MVKNFIIAIDLGGTNLKCALLDRHLKIKARSSFNTKSFDNKERLIQGLAASIESFIAEEKLKRPSILGVGIGMPGPVDSNKGLVHYLPNVPGWKEVQLKEILQRKCGLVVAVDNDAKLMALAEYKLGSAKKYSNVLCLTLGTGVGGGLIIEGQLYRGPDNAAGEFGHMALNEEGPLCGCGGRGCLETYVGNNRIIKEAQKIFGAGITLEEISSLAAKNDARAVDFWHRVGQKIGIAVSSAVNLLNLEAVVIGGGVACAGRVLFESIEATVTERAMRVQSGRVKIMKAKSGNDAGMIGAGYLLLEKLKAG